MTKRTRLVVLVVVLLLVGLVVSTQISIFVVQLSMIRSRGRFNYAA